MHFAGNQLFWECRCCKASENYPDHLPAWATASYDGPDLTPLKSRVHQQRSLYVQHGVGSVGIIDSNGVLASKAPTSEQLDTLYRDWVKWRSEYSRTSVTKDGDKLVAIQGIAQDVGQILNDQLIAGMWKTRILEELCFRVIGENPPRKLPGPSWSWATINEQIVPGEMTRLHRQYTYLTEVCDFHHGSDHKAIIEAIPRLPLLRVRSNLIRAKASWVKLPKYVRQQFGDREESILKSFTLMQTNKAVLCDLDGNGDLEADLDNYLIVVNDRREDISIIVIGYHTYADNDKIAACLLLSPHLVMEGHFERIGYLDVSDECFQILSVESKRSENRVITLV